MAVMLHFSFPVFYLLMYLKTRRKIFQAVHLRKLVMHQQGIQPLHWGSQKQVLFLQMTGVIASWRMWMVSLKWKMFLDTRGMKDHCV